MDHCDAYIEQMTLYLDEGLTHEQKASLLQHLERCLGCKELFATMQQMDELFHAAPMKYAPLGFTERAVNGAFDEALRYNLRLGLLVLLVGTLIIGGMVVMGQAPLISTILSILGAPGFLGSGLLWVREFIEALLIAGRVSLSLLVLLRELMVGPLLVPSLISLLASAFVLLMLRRNDQLILPGA